MQKRLKRQHIMQFMQSQVKGLKQIFSPYKWTLIDGYILGLFIRSVINSLIMFVSINLFAEMAIDLPKYIESIESKDIGIDFQSILLVYIYRLPQMITTISPIAFLLSTIYTIDQIHKNSEAVACISAGIHAFRIIISIWILAFIQCFVLIGVTDLITVPYMNKSDELKSKILQNNTQNHHMNFETFGKNNLYYFIQKYDSTKKVMEYPIIGKTREINFNAINFDTRAFFKEQISKLDLLNVTQENIPSVSVNSVLDKSKQSAQPDTKTSKQPNQPDLNIPKPSTDGTIKTTDSTINEEKKPELIKPPPEPNNLPQNQLEDELENKLEEQIEEPIRISKIYKQLKQSRSPMLKSRLDKEFIDSLSQSLLKQAKLNQFNSNQFDDLKEKYLNRQKQQPVIKKNLDELISKQHQQLKSQLFTASKPQSNRNLKKDNKEPPKKQISEQPQEKQPPKIEQQQARTIIKSDSVPSIEKIPAQKSIVQNVYDLDLLEQVPKNIYEAKNSLRYSRDQANEISTNLMKKKSQIIKSVSQLDERPLEAVETFDLIDSDEWKLQFALLQKEERLSKDTAILKDFSVNIGKHEISAFPSYFEYRMDARKAVWKENIKQWKLYSVKRYTWNEQNQLAKVEYIPFYRLKESLDTPEHFLIKPKQIERMTLDESLKIVNILKESRKKWKGFYINIYYKKIAFMFSTFLIVLIGSTLSKVHSRKLLFLNSLFKAIMLFLSYFIITQGGVSIAKEIAWFPIVLTPWVGNILFLSLGFLLLRRVQT